MLKWCLIFKFFMEGIMDKTLVNRFYLDKEKDIIVSIYREKEDEIRYILETPNHNTGNLITNLAKLCNVETIKDKNDMKIITGVIPASINGDQEIVYIFRLGGIKIANIYENGKVAIKAKIPAITKTLMSQTKDYKLPIEKTIVKSYIFKKDKFRTDLHTHMNANLSPDALISLGIKHQLRYPLYYIKKLKLKMNKDQEEKIMEQRREIEKEFAYIVTGEEVRAGKPQPDIFLKAAEKVGVAPEKCLILEDSYAGGLAAKRAGIPYIIVPDINPPSEEIKGSALFVAESLCEVAALFK